jgi:hypothetical protein
MSACEPSSPTTRTVSTGIHEESVLKSRSVHRPFHSHLSARHLANVLLRTVLFQLTNLELIGVVSTQDIEG